MNSSAAPDSDLARLMECARQVAQNAYAPYSREAVRAILMNITASALRIAFLYNFIEQELNPEKVSYRKSDNAFLAVPDSQAL